MKQTRFVTVLIFSVVCVAQSLFAWASTYQVDKDHTVVSFKIRNFMSIVQGYFRDFEGSVNYEFDKPDTWVSHGTIEVQSIDTKNIERDHHLLSKDFFDIQKFPIISFETTKVLTELKNDAKVEGLLTIHGIKKYVLLDVRDLTVKEEQDGKEHLKFTAITKINRKGFGITYSGAPGIGNVLLGDDVMITLQVDAVRA